VGKRAWRVRSVGFRVRVVVGAVDNSSVVGGRS